MRYPNGSRKRTANTSTSPPSSKKDYSNRGMTLEEDINAANMYYVARNLASVHKKPTPVQIVNVDYPKRSAAVIKEAYFKQASTTDYNGVYKGYHVDFEAKETRNKTSFPLSNIHEHQVTHMEQVTNHCGLSFIIIRFSPLEETYLLESKYVLDFWKSKEKGGRKSIPHAFIKENGYHIPFHFQARVDYLKALDKVLAKLEEDEHV
ncbi:Holliday junction resolvase RecU [Salimicrobium halophilum]|uniref:Holliday junction resolvase RecU n=1 Tax=Salimicrobium halophilum TaxID=86666 RepID=A0A1G8Q284_9BACI|nr:Holliday junction resolvase RecU [Salimicrobium halophilum]SDI98821.1 recombination protein U [Salimicrobium halophilum]